MAARGRPPRRRPCALIRARYRPWYAQQWIHRSGALFRVVVCGRQVGKTHAMVDECLRAALSRRRAFVAIVAPTFVHAEAAIAKLKYLGGAIPGAEWKEQRKRLEIPGGRVIRVFSVDRKETVRGPSILLLALEEAALLSVEARDAALGAITAVPDARVLVTTTPVGRNWVYPWWTRDREKAPELADETESFRVPSKASPYYNARAVAAARAAMTAEKAAQEYDAEFVDSLDLAFPNRDRLWVDEKDVVKRKKPGRQWIGIDLAKTKDWTVLTLMNEWGEGRIIGRWQKIPWPDTYRRIKQALTDHKAVAVIDTGGPGGAPGQVLADHLIESGFEVLGVATHTTGDKNRIVEQARVDVEHGTFVLVRNEHAKQADYEFSRFMRLLRVVRGQEIHSYEGSQEPGEHDDCVISVCLANWGRTHGDHSPDPLAGNFSGMGALKIPAGGVLSREQLGGFGGIPRSGRRAA